MTSKEGEREGKEGERTEPGEVEKGREVVAFQSRSFPYPTRITHKGAQLASSGRGTAGGGRPYSFMCSS